VRHLVDADTAGRHDPPWSGVDDEPVAVIVAEGLPAIVGYGDGVSCAPNREIRATLPRRV
jgi:hypothetical protein